MLKALVVRTHHTHIGSWATANLQEKLWHIIYVSIWSVDLPYRKAIAYCSDGNGTLVFISKAVGEGTYSCSGVRSLSRNAGKDLGNMLALI
jgi:hypothetical protein